MINTIDLSYTDFKARTLGKLFWQYTQESDRYTVFAEDLNTRYETSLLLSPETAIGLTDTERATAIANLADFETNYKDGCNRPNTISPTAAQSQFHGRTIELGADDTTGYCEWSFDKDVYINKVLPMPIDAQKGDYLDFEVWTKPGIVGPDPVKVGQYGFTIPIRGSYPLGWVYGTGGGEIKSYCTVRCYYHKPVGATRDFNVIAEFLV